MKNCFVEQARAQFFRYLLKILSGAVITGSGSAAVLFTITEEAGSVVATVSGSINLAATHGFKDTRARIAAGFLAPAIGGIAVGSIAQPGVYFINGASWLPFGSGHYVGNVTGSGDKVVLYTDGFLGLPLLYTSGNPLSGTATFSGGISSLGLAPGIYTTTLDSGVASDTITIKVVPEVSTSGMLCLGGLSIALRRKRKVKNAEQGEGVILQRKFCLKRP